MHPFSSPSDMNINPNNNNKFPEHHHEHLKCPRCDSSNTKFCYYNNYNLSQPRHFCKNCRRYWTKGGTLRNIPIGGGTRKIATKRSSTTLATSSTSSSSKRMSTGTTTSPAPPPPPLPSSPPEVYRSGGDDQHQHQHQQHQAVVESSGGYPMGPFGNLLMEGLNFNLVSSRSDEDVLIRNPIADDDFRSNFLRLNELNDNDNNNNHNNSNDQSNDQNDVVGGIENGWPDLSIFTPGSSFH